MKSRSQISQAGMVETVPVEVGLRGSDGRVEVLSGLAEGDAVVVSE